MAQRLEAGVQAPLKEHSLAPNDAAEVEESLQKLGKMSHPVAYDVSQANPWGAIWSNVYYMTNEGTGTAPASLGVLNVLRHDGILYSLNDDIIAKYKLGEILKGKDPKTGEFALRNHLYDPGEGDMPMPILTGYKGLMAKGAMVCVCDMAYQVYSGAVAAQTEQKPEDVYNEFVAAKHPGIKLAPSGVWVLGRLAENGIAYIDSSVG